MSSKALRARWLCDFAIGFAAASALGCGSSSDPAETPAQVPETSGVSGGGDTLPVDITELIEPSSGTTPEALSLELNSEVDHVGVRAYLSNADGNPISACQEADIYRIGRQGVHWPVGEAFTLPLSYDTVLSPGLYTQHVRVDSHRGGVDGGGRASLSHYFEVSGGGLRPMTNAEYWNIVEPVMYEADGTPYYAGSGGPIDEKPEPLPCGEPLPYTDEVAQDAGITTVSFDSWASIDTRQPLRCIAPAPTGTGGYSLEFRAQTADGRRLRFGVWSLTEGPPSDFEASLAWTVDPGGASRSSGGSLTIEDADGTSWSSIGGRVHVQRGEGDQLSVVLDDVRLDKSRLISEPEVTRTVPDGSIVGTLMREGAE